LIFSTLLKISAKNDKDACYLYHQANMLSRYLAFSIRHFGTAAEQTGILPPALFPVQIARLEKTAGALLFECMSRRLVLTATGCGFLPGEEILHCPVAYRGIISTSACLTTCCACLIAAGRQNLSVSDAQDHGSEDENTGRQNCHERA